MRRAISRNSFMLALFALVTVSVIAGTWLMTRDRIAEQERAARARALLEIFPGHSHDNKLLDDVLPLPAGALGEPQESQLFIARKQGLVEGMIFPVTAPDGYSGDIRLIVGIRRDGTIAGVRVLAHSETPGLGDRVELKKSDWVLGFNGRSLQDPLPQHWLVQKDGGEFDSFTGATITPRAVVKAVRAALLYYQQHGATLLVRAEGAAPGDTPATNGAP